MPISVPSAGVYLSLKGVIYANNSVIPITEIGETNTTSNTGLQCITDKMPCCAHADQGNRVGEWHFPDGTTVPELLATNPQSTTFYINRGPTDDGSVNLNRLDTSVMSPTGLFSCMVLNATDHTQAVYASIGECNPVAQSPLHKMRELGHETIVES